MFTDFMAALTILVVLGGAVFVVHGGVTGKFVHKEIFHASDSTDCLIVYNGTRVSVDCWVVEGEHDHD